MQAQNLVPNPGFEILDTCPTNQGQLYHAIPWFTPTTNSTSPMSDIFSTCAPMFIVGVPYNGWGHQYPRSGNNYAGLLDYGLTQEGREYISVKLNNVLEINKRYSVSFYVSLSNTFFHQGFYSPGSSYATDRIGAYLSDTAIHLNILNNIPVIPQMENPKGHFLSDTLNWMLVSGIYTAHGGEQYLTIGNFYADDSTNYLKISNNNTHFSFYYIDDVWVSLSTDTSGINEVAEKEIGMDIYPNPASDNVTILLNNIDNSQCTFELYDVVGNRIFSKEFKANQYSVIIPLDNVAKGVYICRILNSNNIKLYNSKLVIVK